jgi:glycosyltransferase involved in cell wall biosynthesis
MARIAVIVPCHDDGPLLRDALDSIEEAEPVEVVVVDDGSSDPQTLELLEDVSSDGVKVVHRPQGGPPAARNTGLEASSSPLVFPLDADDLLLPGALGMLAEALEGHSEAGFAWGDYAIFGDYEGSYRTPDRFLPWTLTYMNPYPVSSLFRREALEAAGGWRWDGRVGYEDWGIWLQFVELGVTGVAVDRVVYRRRVHGTQRVQQHARRNHRALYSQLRERHAAVFARRSELRRLERPPLWKRLAFPVAFGARAVLPYGLEAGAKRLMLRRGMRLSR